MIGFAIKNRNYLLFILLLFIAYFPVFLHLDYMPFRMWDESIMGENAIEMAHNHNYITTYFFGDAYTELEPPLMIWCIVLCSKILGFSELSVRLPSALAALALCIYLFFALRKYGGSAVIGFFTVCILITCRGYIRNHVTRTGEYDSLLVLFSTIFSLHLFMAVESPGKKEQSKHLLLMFLFFTLAVLTKGPACLMQIPGLFIYTVWRKKLIIFLKDKAFYAGVAIFLTFGLGYYLLRESMSPGYMSTVWGNEIGGRYGGTTNGHSGGIWYYLNELVTWQFVSYMFIFPIALYTGLRFCGEHLKKLLCFSSIAGFSFLLVISFSGTKLPHYDAPLFPYLAIITGCFFYLIYKYLAAQFSSKVTGYLASFTAFLAICCLLGKPYYDIVSTVYFPHGDFWEDGFSVNCRYFQYAARNKTPINPYKLIFDNGYGYGPGTVLSCYKEELTQKGLKPQIIGHNELKPGDKAIVFDSGVKHLIENEFEIETTGHLDFCNADIIYIKSQKTKT